MAHITLKVLFPNRLLLTMSAFGVNASGTYRIEGDQIIITYSLFGQEYTWEQSFSQSGNVINIGGTEFKK